MTRVQGETERLVSFHVDASPSSPRALELALTTVLRRKGRVLDSLTEAQRTLRDHLTPPLRDQLDQLAQARSALAAQLYATGEQRASTQRAEAIATLRIQIDDLESRLDDARGEVVRALARLQTVANRAEAASGIAEAEIALQSLRSGTGSARAPETNQIASLVKQSSTEFDKQNYGGALYLAGQAKALVSLARARLGPSDRTVTRPGETLFVLSLRLRTTARGNMRSGPGTSFPIQISLEAGTSLTGYSFVEDWIRVTDDAGRSGWISRSLVALR